MKIAIAGDFCPQHRVADAFNNYKYESVLGAVKPFIDSVDYAIVNFECPVCYGNEKPIKKRGPLLKCTEQGMEAIKWTGFNCVTLANNHFLDYGIEGVKNTIETCKKYTVDYVGGGMNLQEASKILYKKIEGKVIAVINCCEHEFSIATDNMAGSNPLNPIQQYYAIKEAKEESDYVLVIVHGGHEMFQLPSLRMQDTYRFFIDAGADVVINHHQHCYSGYEQYKGKMIFYGLGNFCFDKPKRKPQSWYEGYIVILDYESNKTNFKIIPYTHCNMQATVTMLNDNDSHDFFLSLKNLNKIINDRIQLSYEVDNFYTRSQRYTSSVFEPISNKYLCALQRRGFFPSLLSRKKLLWLYGNLFCESHRDKIEQYLKSTYYKK